MASESKKRARRARRKGEEEEAAAGPSPPVTLTPPPIPDELRSQLSDSISDLIFTAQQVVAMAVQVNCEKREDCPLVDACRELSKRVYNFLEIQRKIARRR